ncbi:hypothetical protein HY991_04350 [Candidatus Micrarchaeota archaeon]|nr:hypothetical protein [Candidatus Micrarchaeota archaeon]
MEEKRSHALEMDQEKKEKDEEEAEEKSRKAVIPVSPILFFVINSIHLLSRALTKADVTKKINKSKRIFYK